MKFLDIFRSQVPSILKRLQDIQIEVGVSHANIRKLMEVEKRLAIQENGSGKIGNAIDGFGVAMWLKDTEGRFLYANKTCCETILKCSQSEVFGLKNGNFKEDALAQVCMKSDVKVLECQKTQRWIEHAIYPDGRHVFVDTVKSPVYDDKGKIIGIVGNAVDITSSIPEVIKEQHDKASSIQVSLDLTISNQQLENILERRRFPRDKKK